MTEVDEKTSGPAGLFVLDPDGNQIPLINTFNI